MALLVAIGARGRIEMIGLIGLYSAAERSHGLGLGNDHGLAQAVHHEPCGLVGDADHRFAPMILFYGPNLLL
jgi:hypothetical protein